MRDVGIRNSGPMITHRNNRAVEVFLQMNLGGSAVWEGEFASVSGM
jgi:hypothetical protein